MSQVSNVNMGMDSLNNITLSKKTKYRSGTMLYLSFFWKNPWLLTLSILFNIISSVLRMAPAIFIGMALDELILNGFSSQFTIIGLQLIGIGALSYGSSFISNYAFAITAFAYERDIRQEYFDSIQNHSLTFHDENNSSKLLAMGMTEISQLRQGIMPALRFVLQSFFSIAFVIYFLSGILDSQLTNLVIMTFIIYFIIAYIFASRIGPIRRKLANTIGDITETTQEIFRGIGVVRAFSARNREVDRFNEQSTEYANLAKKEQQLSAFYVPSLILVILTAYVFRETLLMVDSGILTIGDVIIVVGLLIGLQMVNFMIPQMLLNINAALVNANRIWQKLNWHDPNPEESLVSIPDLDWDGGIVFDNVSFGYNGKLALENISLTIPPKSKVALIGGPGSGKSSFLKLLLQLYVPQSGSISISGVDYNDIPSRDVRQHVARVEQEIFLFSGTIRDNITFTKMNATDEEIESASKAAQAFEFIDELPKRYDTMIGERGVTLSGGQKQRLAISRAILANPRILLLDDSSSALDAKTEKLIRDALNNLSKGRTTITVTQRLNTLVRADLIILLDKGKVLAKGTHDELLDSCEEYQQIFELLPETEQLRKNKGGMN